MMPQLRLGGTPISSLPGSIDLTPEQAPGATPAPLPGSADHVPSGSSGSSGLAHASALLASGTLVSRVLGFVKAIVLVAILGQVSSPGDAFAIANQLPNNIYALIAGGVLGAVLVPQIVRAGLHDDGGQRFINKIVTLGMTAFVIIAVIATIAAPLLIAFYAGAAASDGGRGFTPEGLALATAFAYWCLPQILFYATYSLLGEILNARKAFGPFTWAPVLNNVVAIAGLLVFSLLFGAQGINLSVAVWDEGRIALLAGTATLGVAAQALVLTVFWRRAGLTFRPDFRFRGVGLGRTGRMAGWTFGMILVTQVAAAVQTRVASLATGQGPSVFTLSNSWLIFMLPHSVIAVSIVTAYFTRMSGHASTGNLVGVREDVSSALRTITLLITFAAAALVIVALPFARVFESDFDNVVAMTLVIVASVIGLVPFSALFVMQRAFYSLENTRTPFFIETVKTALFILGALACILLPVQLIGVGIAASMTAAITVQALITFFLLRRRLGGLGGRLLVKRQLQFAGAGIVAAVAGWGVLLLLGGTDAAGFAQEGRVTAIIAIVLIGAAMAIVYFGMLLLVRIPEIRGTVGLVRAKFGRHW